MSIVLMMTLLGLATMEGYEADVDYKFSIRWNSTKFDADKDQGLKESEDEIKKYLRYGYFAQIALNDRMTPFVDMYVKPHCSMTAVDECRACHEQVASTLDDCCVHSYGVEVQSDVCGFRYETYPF
ncbi:hypothetical protein LINGRAHAP2_LOCUS3673 [Linum grandiflorum]